MATGLPDMGKQMGPLPLGAWVIVVGGGLGIAWWTRRTQSSAPTIVEDTSTANGVGMGGSWLAVPPPSSAPPGEAPPTTNEEWGRRCINYLIAQGYDPAMSDSCIRKYLETQQLSTQEYALLQVALKHFGSPPVPLPSPPPPPVIPGPVVQPPPPVVNPPPPPTPTPGPVTNPAAGMVWVVVTPWPTPLSTLSGISKWWYKTPNRWPEIFNANRRGFRRPDGSVGTIDNPDLIYPGQRIWIPSMP